MHFDPLLIIKLSRQVLTFCVHITDTLPDIFCLNLPKYIRRIRIRIILFWIYKYGTISVTIIYNNKYDSRINPGNRYKDIRRGTSVTIRLPGQRKLINKIDI